MTQTPHDGPAAEQQPEPGTTTTAGPRAGRDDMLDVKRLRRSTTDCKIAGVAGGLGRHLDVDPTILRVAFVVLCFFGGAGFVLYGAAWLLVPEDGASEATVSTSDSTRVAVLVTAGVLAALLFLGDAWGGFGFPWPLAIIALVVLALLMNRDRASRRPAPLPAPGVTAYEEHGDPVGAPPPWTPQPQQPYAAPAPKPDRGPSLFGVTLALVAIALGALGIYEALGGSVVDAAYPALALAVTGVMVVLGAWVGRAGGAIFLGIIAAILLAGTSVADGGFGPPETRVYTPTSAAAVDDRYAVPAGSIRLDLTEVADLEALDGRRIELDSNAGEIVVVVPEDLTADVTADIDLGGEAEVLGEVDRGGNVHISQQLDAGAGAPEVELDIELLTGHIEVVRQS